jgi:DNA adenine methylase
MAVLTSQRPLSGPVLEYRGSKWRLAPWILAQFPPHTTYLEPYFGSDAVFFSKAPLPMRSSMTSGDVVNLFRVLREHGQALAALIQMTPWARSEYEESYTPCEERLEAARRFLVRCWQAQHLDFTRHTAWRHRGRADHSSTTALWAKLLERLLQAVERLQRAGIECQPALDLLQRHAQPDVLLYVDPPYVLATRGRRRLYTSEMRDAEHLALLDALDAHPGPVVLSGYASPLYDQRLTHWRRLEAASVAEGGGRRTEVLWVKAGAVGSARAGASTRLSVPTVRSPHHVAATAPAPKASITAWQQRTDVLDSPYRCISTLPTSRTSKKSFRPLRARVR